MWVSIEDKEIRHLWECPNCSEYTYVQPCWYSENGTPMCTECDDDMEYIRTEQDL